MRGNGNGTKNANGSNFEIAVLQRYAEASRKAEAGLCVPISYNCSLLEVIPQEEKDYVAAIRRAIFSRTKRFWTWAPAAVRLATLCPKSWVRRVKSSA
jgi:hypothetical protein